MYPGHCTWRPHFWLLHFSPFQEGVVTGQKDSMQQGNEKASWLLHMLLHLPGFFFQTESMDMANLGFESYLEILDSRKQLSISGQSRYVFISIIAVAHSVGMACLLVFINLWAPWEYRKSLARLGICSALCRDFRVGATQQIFLKWMNELKQELWGGGKMILQFFPVLRFVLTWNWVYPDPL